jgi:hypothetical protein
MESSLNQDPVEGKASMSLPPPEKAATMNEAGIHSLLRVKQVIATLKAIDQRQLSERERYALEDSLAQAYARAWYFIRQLTGKEQPHGF